MSDDAIADDILRNVFDRWQRLEEEKLRISEDLKELFAEAGSNGFNAKALRVAFRRAVKANDAAEQQLDMTVELYVSVLLGTNVATHTRAAREAKSAASPFSGANTVVTPVSDASVTGREAIARALPASNTETAPEPSGAGGESAATATVALPAAHAADLGPRTTPHEGAPAAGEAGSTRAALAVNSRGRPIREGCLNGEACASSKWPDLCHECGKAWRAAHQGAAA